MVLSHGTALGRGIVQMGEMTIPEDPEVRGSCLGGGGCERRGAKVRGSSRENAVAKAPANEVLLEVLWKCVSLGL